jgi:hypothetical protein
MLQEALRLDEKNKAPEDPDFHYHLGLAYILPADSDLINKQTLRGGHEAQNVTGSEEVLQEIRQGRRQTPSSQVRSFDTERVEQTRRAPPEGES